MPAAVTAGFLTVRLTVGTLGRLYGIVKELILEICLGFTLEVCQG